MKKSDLNECDQLYASSGEEHFKELESFMEQLSLETL